MLFSLNLKTVHSIAPVGFDLASSFLFCVCSITKLLYGHVQFKVYGASSFGDMTP